MSLSPLQRYLGHYPAKTQAQVQTLIDQGRLGAYLARAYPQRHEIQTDAALYRFATDLKQRHLRSAPPLHKVAWQNRIDVMQQVLGLHTRASRVQGSRLKAKAEIRIASLFKELAPEFLLMVVVHELAHLREHQHNKAFYQLCCHLQPAYHQVEFDLRLTLMHRALGLA